MVTQMKLRSNRDVDDLNAKRWSTCEWSYKLKGRSAAKESNLNSQEAAALKTGRKNDLDKDWMSDHEVIE